MICPYCRAEIQPNRTNGRQIKCPEKDCNRVLPPDWCHNPGPLIGLVGFTGHGKTAYLTSLFYALQELSKGQIWDQFTSLPLHQEALDHVYLRVPDFARGKLPPGTPQFFPTPTIIQFEGVPRPFEPHLNLCFFDAAGNIFEQAQDIGKIGKVVLQSDVVLFIISLIDCKGDQDNMVNEIDRLLTTYIVAAEDNGVPLYNKDLIVVLSKADSIPDKELNSIIDNGRLDEYKCKEGDNVKALLKSLAEISGRIKKWFRGNGAANFVNLSQTRFKSVEYTAVSATGSAPQNGELVTFNKNDPKRVLDPFLWVLEKRCRMSSLRMFWG